MTAPVWFEDDLGDEDMTFDIIDQESHRNDVQMVAQTANNQQTQSNVVAEAPQAESSCTQSVSAPVSGNMGETDRMRDEPSRVHNDEHPPYSTEERSTLLSNSPMPPSQRNRPACAQGTGRQPAGSLLSDKHTTNQSDPSQRSDERTQGTGEQSRSPLRSQLPMPSPILSMNAVMNASPISTPMGVAQNLSLRASPQATSSHPQNSTVRSIPGPAARFMWSVGLGSEQLEARLQEIYYGTSSPQVTSVVPDRPRTASVPWAAHRNQLSRVVTPTAKSHTYLHTTPGMPTPFPKRVRERKMEQKSATDLDDSVPASPSGIVGPMAGVREPNGDIVFLSAAWLAAFDMLGVSFSSDVVNAIREFRAPTSKPRKPISLANVLQKMQDNAHNDTEQGQTGANNEVVSLQFKYTLRSCNGSEHCHERIPQLLVGVKELTACDGEFFAVFQDPWGRMEGGIQQRAVNMHAPHLRVGCVLLLQNVTIFNPTPTSHYLNVVADCITEVFPVDGVVPKQFTGEGSDVLDVT